MSYKDKHDPRYRNARMCWYYANKSKHLAIAKQIIKEKKDFINKFGIRLEMRYKSVKLFVQIVIE